MGLSLFWVLWTKLSLSLQENHKLWVKVTTFQQRPRPRSLLCRYCWFMVVMGQSAPDSPGMSLLPLLKPTKAQPKFWLSLSEPITTRTTTECSETSFLLVNLVPLTKLELLNKPVASLWLESKVSIPQTIIQMAWPDFLLQLVILGYFTAGPMNLILVMQGETKVRQLQWKKVARAPQRNCFWGGLCHLKRVQNSVAKLSGISHSTSNVGAQGPQKTNMAS